MNSKSCAWYCSGSCLEKFDLPVSLCRIPQSSSGSSDWGFGGGSSSTSGSGGGGGGDWGFGGGGGDSGKDKKDDKNKKNSGTQNQSGGSDWGFGGGSSGGGSSDWGFGGGSLAPFLHFFFLCFPCSFDPWHDAVDTFVLIPLRMHCALVFANSNISMVPSYLFCSALC